MLVCYTDINECLIDNGGCEFSCTNLEGTNSTTGLGYQCGCDNGYQLAPNNHNCIGTCVCVWVNKAYIRAHIYISNPILTIKHMSSSVTVIKHP